MNWNIAEDFLAGLLTKEIQNFPGRGVGEFFILDQYHGITIEFL